MARWYRWYTIRECNAPHRGELPRSKGLSTGKHCGFRGTTQMQLGTQCDLLHQAQSQHIASPLRSRCPVRSGSTQPTTKAELCRRYVPYGTVRFHPCMSTIVHGAKTNARWASGKSSVVLLVVLPEFIVRLTDHFSR